MAGSVLVPVNVVAKRLVQNTTVPALEGAAFNRDVTLEAGIHLHWALPDALVRAKV
jgi:hypothetical protein